MVDSFSHNPSDLSARLNGIVRDLNDKPCALLKVKVNDEITNCEGGNVGEMVKRGTIKYIYISPTARYIQLEFDSHFPLTITFADYGYKCLKGLASYEVIIKEVQQNNSQAPVSQQNFVSSSSAVGFGSRMKEEFIVKGVKFSMICVEGGTFSMGATEEMQYSYSDEKPVHPVTLPTYYIGETEVTWALWKAVMEESSSFHIEGDSYPAGGVSWYDCQIFIKKLNQLTGRIFSLPTEAQWEYAARGGKKSRHTQYSGSNNIDDVAWYHGNCESKIHPVGQKLPNELGLYDMTGNVWEWCFDWKGSYRSDSQIDPTGPDRGDSRVCRGGSWDDDICCCHSSSRLGYTPSNRRHNVGFRLALLQ